MKRLRKFLSGILVALCMIATPICAGIAASNLGAGDIGDFGTWATEHNRTVLVGDLRDDLQGFSPSANASQLVNDGVPVDARLGMAFLNAISYIGNILDTTLVRFVIIFMLVMYALWIGIEAYTMMTKTSDVKKVVTEIVKKGALLTFWIVVLRFGMRDLFMAIIGPIISIGTTLCDIILNAITTSVGATLPDTCGPILDYARAHAGANPMISPEHAAEIMCVPSRMTAFAATGIVAGWKWMIAGVGTSMLTFIAGLVCVIMFVYLLWRFSLMALGVIADLFLVVLMLPFTAIKETALKPTDTGILGELYKGFNGLFKTDDLSSQIARFVNAAIYFVSLSVVIGICAGMLAGVLDATLVGDAPAVYGGEFWTLLLTCCLVSYIAHKWQQITTDLGGKITTQFVDNAVKDAKTWFNKGRGYYDKARKAYKDAHK